jgi:DNA invertase Pin-like site-specific DNA recombinase
MSRRRRIGVSYGRFSDPKQAQGDSEGRQERMYRAFCHNHNLTPLTEVFLDKGRSGYKDEHRKKGRLGVLIQYAKDGRFEPGTVIVVEAWDRLGRLRPDKQTALVAELLQTGVDIGVCQLNDVFTENDFGTHKWTTLAVFIQLAYQESKQKAERMAASWETRRERARAGEDMPPRKKDGLVTRAITGRLPAWLELANGKVRLRPGPAAAVKRIFALAGQGLGKTRIAAALLREKVPAFGPSGAWVTDYIHKILTDRRVLGECQLRKAGGVPDGPAIAGYFPRVIEDPEWDLARAGLEERRGTDRRGRALVRAERKHVNTFRGLVTNALDGESFYLAQRSEGLWILRNHGGAEGHGATSTFPYLVFEEAILSLLREVDPEEVLPRAQAGPSKAEVLRARLANVRHDLAGIQASLKGGYSKALDAVLRAKEAEEERVAAELQEEQSRTTRPAAKAWEDFPGLAEMVKQGGDEARLRLRPVLRRVVNGLWMVAVRRGSYKLAAVQAWFADSDQHRSYLIVHRAGAYRRPGGWWARSFAAAALPAGLDLRKKKDAADLEKVLLAVDVKGLTGPG